LPISQTKSPLITRVISYAHLYANNSFSLKYFKAPKNAASNCLKCPAKVEAGCPYSAKKIYLDKLIDEEQPRLPMTAVCDIEDHPG
jgi:hypothetical protein